MILLVLLFSIFVYCSYNYYFNKDTNSYDTQFAYYCGSWAAAILFICVTLSALAAGITSAANFEAILQERAVLEYEAAHPLSRDYNFYEQVAAHNSAIVANQKYNQDWFFKGISISDKWDSIEPIVLERRLSDNSSF